jgi:hypothetical protein
MTRFTKCDYIPYLDTLVVLIDRGDLSTKDASVQYWADWQMEKVNEMEYFKEEV